MEISIDNDQLETTRREAVPRKLREALGDTPAFLVGGAVRDALMRRPLGDVDLAVEGELDPILNRLGLEARSHERFGTATVVVDGRQIDIARTRRETYPEAGALPEVEPALIRADLGRRDFTINALALPLEGEMDLLDPYDGLSDLRAGLLRVITPRSFADDPTRALRAARYCARLGFRLEPRTEELLRESRLETVSNDRINADLFRLAAEREAVRGFDLLSEWGLIDMDGARRALLADAAELARVEPWASLVPRSDLLLDIVTAPEARLQAAADLLHAAESGIPDSQLFELACAHDDRLLGISRALGAKRLDEHISEWRRVRLTIGGAELIEAGVPAGPDRGRALRAALHARIDGRIDGDPAAELRVALEAIDRG